MLRDFHRAAALLLIVAVALLIPACRSESDSQTLRPRQLRDVPANKLAFNFQADVQPPANLLNLRRTNSRVAIGRSNDIEHDAIRDLRVSLPRPINPKVRVTVTLQTRFVMRDDTEILFVHHD